MFRAIVFVASVLLVIGCTQQHERVIHASTEGHAECLVCKYNADLACLDVSINDQTPTFDYNGKRYYFCSEECRDDFAKNPQKYLPSK